MAIPYATGMSDINEYCQHVSFVGAYSFMMMIFIIIVAVIIVLSGRVAWYSVQQSESNFVPKAHHVTVP
jgi:hypothetical protein